ncbi:MAG: fumarylacetoacetate hydrolase family protein [Planctomycetota bacterium]|nr:fumarylacetoacetate hydrolase family protein [Planctomycetota bacterium]
MKLAKYKRPQGNSAIAVSDGKGPWRHAIGSDGKSLRQWLEATDLTDQVTQWLEQTEAAIVSADQLLTPVDDQEVWAAGVTYRRSQTARMEESEAAASCYDRVYTSPRPELFFKATPHRVVGLGQPVRIRLDSHWNVPEPELTLALNSRLEIVGYTIGNDMSSRDIEGENPLYLPQAKVYRDCCAIGPCITLAGSVQKLTDVHIHLNITRKSQVVFEGTTSIAQMARTPEDLVSWLGRDNSFPTGAFLLTGTGIVPPREFTLQPDDLITMSIDGIGTLVNSVIQG